MKNGTAISKIQDKEGNIYEPYETERGIWIPMVVPDTNSEGGSVYFQLIPGELLMKWFMKELNKCEMNVGTVEED